jgi:CMP/dCMP kinase
MIITIDGPAGTGKTTVARHVAERLHFSYFDTGAMYRAVTWVLLEKKIPLSDLPRIEKVLKNFVFSIQGEGKEKKYFVGEKEVTKQIRCEEVTSHVSAVSALPLVREALWKFQRAFATLEDAVFEGRDMGTVVFPKAEIKIFLTARPEIRAERRLQEIIQKNPEEALGLTHEQMIEEILRRDNLDSKRSLAPLKCPEDAYVIDTSDLSIDEVVECILKYKMGKEASLNA